MGTLSVHGEVPVPAQFISDARCPLGHLMPMYTSPINECSIFNRTYCMSLVEVMMASGSKSVKNTGASYEHVPSHTTPSGRKAISLLPSVAMPFCTTISRCGLKPIDTGTVSPRQAMVSTLTLTMFCAVTTIGATSATSVIIIHFYRYRVFIILCKSSKFILYMQIFLSTVTLFGQKCLLKTFFG